MTHPEYPPAILSRAEPSDIPTLARIHVDACAPDLAISLYFTDKSQFAPLVAKMLREQVSDPAWVIVKATDVQSKQIAAWASWKLVEHAEKTSPERKDGDPEMVGEREEKMVQSSASRPKGAFPFPAGLGAYVRANTDRVIRSWMADRKHIILNGLFTDPLFQRRGIGTALLCRSNEMADERHWPCFLQGSPYAHKLYVAMGWKDVGFLDVDLKEWAPEAKEGERGWGNYRFWYMLRLPKGSKCTAAEE